MLTVEPPKQKKKSYAQIPDYLALAKEYFPDQKALQPFESMPEYGATKRDPNIENRPEYASTTLDTNIQNRPEYLKASSWDLPEAPKLARTRYVDPTAYENQWNLSSEALRKSFYDPGGTNQQAVDLVLERGLGTSGDKGRVMGEVAESFANALANARMGLDIGRMEGEAATDATNVAAENALNKYIFGEEVLRRKGISDAASGLLDTRLGLEKDNAATALDLLGERLGIEEDNAATALDLLGKRADMDMYESELPTKMGKTRLDAATALTKAQNDVLDNAWDQEFESEKYEDEKALGLKTGEEALRDKQFEQFIELIGAIGFPEEDQRRIIEEFARQPGSPIADFYPTTSNEPIAAEPSTSADDQAARDAWNQFVRQPGNMSMRQERAGNTSLAGKNGEPPFPGAYPGEVQPSLFGRPWVWTGESWTRT